MQAGATCLGAGSRAAQPNFMPSFSVRNFCWLSTRKDKKNIMAKQKQLSPKYQVWIDAPKRHKLSHAHIQMARELGMNPNKFGKLDNHRQESWKAPLPVFIENLYFKRFGKRKPEKVRSIEQMVKDKKRKLEKSQQGPGEGPAETVPL
jgi:hypothetical protein